MQVHEVMTRSVELIDPNTTIRDAARRMRDGDLGALPVGENDRLIGMVTDRDITVRAVAEDRPAGNTPVREVMSEGIIYCFEDDPLDQAAKVMRQHLVRRLPVLTHDKRLVGVIALADLARHGAEGAEAYKDIAQPTEEPRRQ